MSNKSIAILFPGAARSDRVENIKLGLSPKDFFYGSYSLPEKGFPIELINTQTDPPEYSGKILLKAEYLRSRLLKFGLYTQRVNAIADKLIGKEIAISFTDTFSLSMGIYGNRLNESLSLVGGFHGLADMPDFGRAGLGHFIKGVIQKATSRLDHLFFFGPADRKRSIELYSIPEDKTSLFPFGIDLEFWVPLPEKNSDNSILAVGSDIKRDYKTLLLASMTSPLNIVTNLHLDKNLLKSNVTILKGNLTTSKLTDIELRKLYNSAEIVVVPLLDVWQPTGYSVTLQAMACAKPVILSDIKGLWDREVFQSGVNCILIPPEEPVALSEAIKILLQNSELRVKIGLAARETAVKHFGLERMENALVSMIQNLTK